MRSPRTRYFLSFALSIFPLTAATSCSRAVSLPEPPAILSAAEAASPRARAGQWSGWRGGELGGVWRGKSLPLEWSEEAGILWRVELADRGNSSPIVWGPSIYLTGEKK